ncbi:MAG: hypothetical protein AB7Q29_07635 [Vicinamibacterales bacterium]
MRRTNRRNRLGTRLWERIASWPRAWQYALLAAAVIGSLPLVTMRLYASDEIEYFAYLRSMWFDRDLSFDNEYHYFYDRGIAHGVRPLPDGSGVIGGRFSETFLEAETPTGRRFNFAPVGTAIMWTPFYAAADLGVRIARALGASVPADGFSQPYIAAVTLGSAFYGILAIVLSTIAVRQVFGTGDLSAAAIGAGTPLLFYTYIAPGYSHACSAAVVAALVVVWLRVRRDWAPLGVIALGALAALTGMVREQDAFIALGPAIDFATTAVRSVRTGKTKPARWILHVVAGVATTALCVLPQAFTYLALYGRLGPSTAVAEKMSWTAPYVWKLLASTEYGALFWSPILVPAFAGLALLVAGAFDRAIPVHSGTNGTHPATNEAHPAIDETGLSDTPWISDTQWIGVICAIMVGTQLWISGSVSSWTGSAFGQRRLIGLTVCLSIGLSAAFRAIAAGCRRQILLVVVCVCVWWNLGLVAQYGSGLMDRQRLELGRNAYNNFVTVPIRLPRLVYRYVFDRPSFYRGPAGRPTSGR